MLMCLVILFVAHTPPYSLETETLPGSPSDAEGNASTSALSQCAHQPFHCLRLKHCVGLKTAPSETVSIVERNTISTRLLSS